MGSDWTDSFVRNANTHTHTPSSAHTLDKAHNTHHSYLPVCPDHQPRFSPCSRGLRKTLCRCRQTYVRVCVCVFSRNSCSLRDISGGGARVMGTFCRCFWSQRVFQGLRLNLELGLELGSDWRTGLAIHLYAAADWLRR